MEKKFICIIPVKYDSTRFPGKPFKKISGKTMLKRVYENASAASLVEKVVVAAYDQKIEDYCKKEAMSVVRVNKSVKNGSEAVADVAKNIDTQYIFEMKGDQPLVIPEIIDDFLTRAQGQVEKNLKIDVVHPFTEADEKATNSLDVLKVVKTDSDKLIFQTRQPIQTGYRTLGLYLWNRRSLLKFASLPISKIEKAEDSHPIRLYINDMVVQGIPIENSNWIEVDRPHQIKEVELMLKQNEE